MTKSVGEQNKTVSYHNLRPWAALALELLCEKLPGSLVAVCQSPVGEQIEEVLQAKQRKAEEYTTQPERSLSF